MYSEIKIFTTGIRSGTFLMANKLNKVRMERALDNNYS